MIIYKVKEFEAYNNGYKTTKGELVKCTYYAWIKLVLWTKGLV